jgi:hypothetical protein
MTDIETNGGLIRVQKTNFQGNDYIDIRKFYLDKNTEEPKPTKKGITFSPELKDQIIKALSEL